MSSKRGHRAGQCAPEVPRTRIRARGDLQEGHVYDKRLRGYAFRYQFPPFPVPIPILPSTKIGLLCAFGLWEPSFQAVRAQKVGFFTFFTFGTPDFWLFKHKIEVFVRFCQQVFPDGGS